MKLVTAAIVRRGGSILIARRGPGEKLAGYWEFPGGKVDDGESLETCLVREIREELGVNAHPGRMICESDYVYEHGAFRIVAIETSLDSTDFDLSVHDRIAWVSPSELVNVALLPADKPIAQTLKEQSNDETV